MSIAQSRLQVLLNRKEYQALQRFARQRGQTLGAWVREVLREAVRGRAARAGDEKIAVIRQAVRHAFPTGEIDQLLRETAQGYGEDSGQA